MSRWFWVRHGPTHARGMVGWSDLPADLSDTARLERLGAYLPGDALIISSDLSRARTTADAIAGPRDRLANDPALREMHFGEWELQDFDSIPDQTRLRAFWDEPGLVRPPGGESWHDVCARVDQGVGRLIDAHPGRDFIVVAHFGTILTQLQNALGVSAVKAFAHRIDNLSVSEMHLKGNGWLARRINHCP